MSSQNPQAVIDFNTANKLYDSSLFEEALSHYQKAINLDLSFYDAHFCVAKTLLRLKKHDQGLSHFNKFKHLIPKPINYSLAIANILQEENQEFKAFNIINSIDTTFSIDQLSIVLPVLIKNNKLKKGIHLILNAEQISAESLFEKLLINKNISKLDIDLLKKENIIPKYYFLKTKFDILRKSPIKSETFKSLIEAIRTSLTEIKKPETIHYVKALKETNQLLKASQEELYQLSQTKFLTNVQVSNKIANILKETDFEKSRLAKIQSNILAIKTKNRKNALKKIIISSSIILVLSIVSYFTLNWYEKNKAYKNALTSEEIHIYILTI